MNIKITVPKDREDAVTGKTMKFVGTADSDVIRVEVFADGRWSLGGSDVSSGNWTIPYTFNTAGTRQILVKGFDSSDNAIASHSIWLFVQPTPINLDEKLTPNFTVREFTISPTADRFGIDNTPNAQEIQNLRTLCEKILQPARDALGPLKISSGFRSEALNRSVGGTPTSDHRLGFAADVTPINVGTRQLAEWIVRNVPEFDQVILEFGTLANPNWIHISAAPRKRKQVLQATLQAGATVYTDISDTIA